MLWRKSWTLSGEGVGTRQQQYIIAWVRAHALSSPVWLFSVSIGAFVVIFQPGGIMGGLDILARSGLTFGSIIAFSLWGYFLMPGVFVRALAIGWPLFLVQVVAYLPVAAAYSFILLLMEREPASLVRYLWILSTIMAIVLIATAIGLLMFQLFLLPKAGLDIEPEEGWRFRSAKKCGVTPLLPADMRGPLLRMSAENQYLRVYTARGEALIRLSLSKAEGLAADGRGMRVHRSHWIAFELMDELRHEGGNPRLLLKDGATLPVSRDKAAAIKGVLNERRTQSVA